MIKRLRFWSVSWGFEEYQQRPFSTEGIYWHFVSKYVTISALKPILHRLSAVELASQDGDLPLACQLKR